MKPIDLFRAGFWGSLPGGDPHWDKVIALLHLDSISNDGKLLDEAGGVWGVEPAPYLDTAIKKFGAGSIRLNGVNEKIWSEVNDKYKLGFGDFTIEMFVRPSSSGKTNYARLFQLGKNNRFGGVWLVADGTSDPIRPIVEVHTGSSYVRVLTSDPAKTIPNDAFTHIALTRESGVWRLFISGVMTAEANFTGPGSELNAGASLPYYTVGANESRGECFNGHIDEFRLTKGVARYTANFTPPSAPFPSE